MKAINIYAWITLLFNLIMFSLVISNFRDMPDIIAYIWILNIILCPVIALMKDTQSKREEKDG